MGRNIRNERTVFESPQTYSATATICWSLPAHPEIGWMLMLILPYNQVSSMKSKQYGSMLCDEWTFFLVHERVNHLLQLRVKKKHSLVQPILMNSFTISCSQTHKHRAQCRLCDCVHASAQIKWRKRTALVPEQSIQMAGYSSYSLH